MIFLAHRGVWAARDQQNTLESYRAAFERGWGVELDVRDVGGELVIAHDVPTGPALAFDVVLALHAGFAPPPWIAVNIKADGLNTRVAAAAERHGLKNFFVFDMSVPDALHYLRAGLPTFTRHSEYEAEPSFYHQAEGIWLDCFLGPWVDPVRIIGDLGRGKRVALVSPELHGKPHATAWAVWKAALARAGLPAALVAERLMLCTDLPAAAQAFFADLTDGSTAP